MSDERPTYRFRWVNIDLDAFEKQRRFVADDLRRQAKVLNERADQIEEEARHWVNALEEVPNE